ncbi:unnamed protein product [Alopecurus aequalis]
MAPPELPPPKKKSAPTTVLALGDDLLREVFLRLPSLPSLVRAALACPAFLRAVRSSPAFRRRFRDLHSPPLLSLFLINEETTPPTYKSIRLRSRSDPDHAAALRGLDATLTLLPNEKTKAKTPKMKTWKTRTKRRKRTTAPGGQCAGAAMASGRSPQQPEGSRMKAMAGETKDGKLCLVYGSDLDLDVWIRGAGNDGVDTWMPGGAFWMDGGLDKLGVNIVDEYPLLNVVAIIDGIVYFSIQQEDPPIWLLSFCLETMMRKKICTLTPYEFCYPYIMAWPPSFVRNQAEAVQCMTRKICSTDVA